MKLVLIVMASLSAGAASVEHIHSYILGLSVAFLAVSSGYWFAFRTSRFPELALFLLICGLLAKLLVTIAGIAFGISLSLISSPLVFTLSYLYFSLVITYLWFSYRDSMIKNTHPAQ